MLRAPRLPHEGRNYPLVHEPQGWRLRSRAKMRSVDFRTGTHNLTEAKRRAKEFLAREIVTHSRRGGGSLEALAQLYIATPKRTKEHVAQSNVSRLRSICRTVLERELDSVTCREVSPDLWRRYQQLALEKSGRTFDLTTRYRENIAINSAIRAACCLFLPELRRTYQSAGLDVRPDASEHVTLPEPYVPPVVADDSALVTAWAKLTDKRLWLTIGLARFAGLRRDEIAHARIGWIDGDSIALRDRPEENFWTKTGKPYRAQIINADLLEWLGALNGDGFIVPDTQEARAKWFETVPQAWLRSHGFAHRQPLHRLRGLYADAVAQLTADAVTARLAAVRAAQTALGHTTPAITEKHYLSANALR